MIYLSFVRSLWLQHVCDGKKGVTRAQKKNSPTHKKPTCPLFGHRTLTTTTRTKGWKDIISKTHTKYKHTCHTHSHNHKSAQNMKVQTHSHNHQTAQINANTSTLQKSQMSAKCQNTSALPKSWMSAKCQNTSALPKSWMSTKCHNSSTLPKSWMSKKKIKIPACTHHHKMPKSMRTSIIMNYKQVPAHFHNHRLVQNFQKRKHTAIIITQHKMLQHQKVQAGCHNLSLEWNNAVQTGGTHEKMNVQNWTTSPIQRYVFYTHHRGR